MTTKITEFKSAAIEIVGGKTIIYLNCKDAWIYQQIPLIEGQIEYYDDGSISIYGYKVLYGELWSNYEHYWLEEQDNIKKNFCKSPFVEAEWGWPFFTNLFYKLRHGKDKPKIKYLRPKGKKSGINMTFRKKVVEDFRMNILLSSVENLIIYEGMNRLKKGD